MSNKLDKNGDPIDWEKVAVRMWSELTGHMYDLGQIEKQNKNSPGIKYKKAMSGYITWIRKELMLYFQDHPEELHEEWELEDFDD